MAELLSALLPTLLKKAGDSLFVELSFMGGIERRRQKLHDLLLGISEVVIDAEEQVSRKPAVKSWIARLKLAACDAEDALDELQYEALRHDALRRGHKVNGPVRGFFSPHYNPLLFKYKMGKKLEGIVERINDLVEQMNKFSFVKDRLIPMADSDRMPTHSFVDDQHVVGREEDMQEIAHKLVSADGEILSIIVIFGIGGLGKTTLAQLIFNDARVQAHFQKYLWVCVSDVFNVPDIVKKIIDSSIGCDCGLKNDNMELLYRRFRQEVSQKKHLIVLDDVWNEDTDKWDALRTLLGLCGLGSVIVVTTRSLKVAEIMGTVKPLHLKPLSPEDSWTVFSRRAFGAGVVESFELLEIGKKIVHKCCGVPLAIKSMGGLMSTKHDIRDWKAMLESHTWNEKDPILPALRLSYKHLPSYMKQCFVFCAVFPKDHEIEVWILIHLWISNGFVPSRETSALETTATEIFRELSWRSFFQDIKQVRPKKLWPPGAYRYRYGYNAVTTCKIHDLMHDLAQDISGEECFSLGPFSRISNKLMNARHLTYPIASKIGLVMHHCPNSRSIFDADNQGGAQPVTDLIFKESSLRVAGVHTYGIESFCVEPAFMKHLRYLDMSSSNIKELPEATSALYNLQVLMLNNCTCLTHLPEGMQYMVSLRHVYLDGCRSLKHTPANLGLLSSLQTLTKYVVRDEPGCGIKELKNLKLGGKLHIDGLMKVTNQSDARDVNLESKENLDQLTFSGGRSEEILDALKPHNGLKVLNINGYVGVNFPRWVTDGLTLHKLVELRLCYCVRCSDIPPVWQLPFLEVLELEGMHNLTYLCSNYSMDEGCSHSAPTLTFPKLKFLSLDSLDLLERWNTNGEELSVITFPVLCEMKIFGCPKLETLPKVPLLESFETGNMVLIGLAAGLTTLSSLCYDSRGISSVELNNPSKSVAENTLADPSFPWGSLTGLTLRGFNLQIPHDEEHKSDLGTQIKKMYLHDNCDCFIQPDTQQSPLWFWKIFINLEELKIWNCDGLTCWPEEEFRSLTSLKELRIVYCKNFTCLSPTPLSVKPADDGLRNLERLHISNCPNLMVFPKCFSSLKSLYVEGSSKVESIPEELGRCAILESLSIKKCPSLTYLPASIQCLSNLSFLCLTCCNSLTALPEGMQNLTALRSLDIISCPGVKALPEGLQQRLHSLRRLDIKDCPALARRCEAGGDYWEKVKDIPLLTVTGVKRSAWRDAAARAIIPTCTNAWSRSGSIAQQLDN